MFDRECEQKAAAIDRAIGDKASREPIEAETELLEQATVFSGAGAVNTKGLNALR
jgi:hypothetical protein